MKTYIENYKHFGELLFVEKGDIKLGIPLSFGIRILFLSYKNSENLLFEQPQDDTFLVDESGWRIYGGHRYWIAPESDDDYALENMPISYKIDGEKIILTQNEDLKLKVIKSIEISFDGENRVKLLHKMKSTMQKPRKFSSWAITSLDGGGTQYIPIEYNKQQYFPLTRISMWYYTNLGDKRAEYFENYIKLSHGENDGKRFKIGVSHPNGPINYINHGVVFEKIYQIFKDKEYPDGNSSYETYMCDFMTEVESLSPLSVVDYLQTTSFEEIWQLSKE